MMNKTGIRWYTYKKEESMLSEKPWRKEFDDLLEKMKAFWGGQITSFDDTDIPAEKTLSSLYVYPIYKATVDGFPLQVTISEFPLPGGGLITAADNVEFLSILLIAPCAFKAAIRHEHLMDRIKKKLGLEYEAQTGNEKFDEKYFLITALKEDVSILKSDQVQQHIMDLEPFDGLHFSKGGINFTHSIFDKNMLKVQNVEVIAKRLVTLANLVQQK
ncbi:MAG: hypothetical protein JSU85_15665 [Candidatus Zixiibacteriota bacterium]|nr:MAG: hypothetical protein JSU85_15665 [candidate division Zixibacteria bacterium]